MTDAEKRLAACLDRLLHACTHMDRTGVPSAVRREFAAAREQAARALLLQRAREGRPLLPAPHLSTFLERWRLAGDRPAVEGGLPS
jgi:hypothetical protein